MDYQEDIPAPVIDADVENSVPITVERPNPRARPNLIPYHFKPGQSGNPGGRPKRGALTTAFADILDQPVPKEQLRKLGTKLPIPKKATYAHLAAYAMVQQMLRGNVQAMREVLNRTEGRIPHSVNMQSTDKLDELRAALLAGPMEPGETNPVPEDDEEEE